MKVIDLFAGIGGLSLGFQNAGFEIVAAIDNWQEAMEIYQANFNHDALLIDLSQMSDYQKFKNYHPDIIIGGPPCQDFSSAGKRDESLGRADLTISFANIIAQVKPTWFVMENVERITKSVTLQKALKIFKEAEYGLSYQILDASRCGVPQLRKRFFLVGLLAAPDGFLDYYLNHYLTEKPMTIFDYLGNELGIEYYYRHPWSYKRRAIFSIYEPSPTIRGVNRPIPKGYKKHPGDAVEITENFRPLSTIERSYLQTFPKGFKLKGTKSQLEQMIGNAVPIKIGEYVANKIKAFNESGIINSQGNQINFFFN